ncbi:hypothetical protein [Propionivibrio dicarboxylicus]|uniref:Uncharacterized protein n=1 Tax=Propionivibrio dicarboxylicus TaxID=83767 RepID=A0A1G8I374_9RHOO|nr:hypothetical protein [Propionivibrio dicarboxylicus]SDI13323.1 hypothetical protein SAMN05660652_02917 [Propionivibrio dicarboxylicus]
MGIQESFVLAALCAIPELATDAFGEDATADSDEKSTSAAKLSEGLMSIFHGCADVW